MDKLKFETPDMVAGNIDKIAELFPAAMTEMRGEDGEIKRGVNFEVLKQLLSREVVDGDECYEFTWVGKKAAMAEAARPITKTLRPVKEDSRDWDTSIWTSNRMIPTKRRNWWTVSSLWPRWRPNLQVMVKTAISRG